MRFDDKLADMFDEVDVPDELSPQNIAIMLKAKNNQSKMVTEHRNIKSVPSIAAQRRTIIMRTVSATAACAIFAAGMIAYNKTNPDNMVMEPRTEYQAVTPEDYGDLLRIYTDISLDSSDDTETNTGTDESSAYNEIPVDTDIVIKQIESTATLIPSLSEDEFSEYKDEKVTKADIVKSDGTNLYCITDDILYVIDMKTMDVVAKIEHNLTPPVEIYIENDMLILISKDTDEVQIFAPETTTTDDSVPAETSTTSNSENDNSNMSTQTSNAVDNNRAESLFKSGAAYPGKTALTRSDVIVNIYDISDKTFPEYTTSYKQNGGFISSRIVDGVLYIVTDYSDYRTGPLGIETFDEKADLDTFVPAYYINDEKHYVAATDIIVPNNAVNTDYTVVSAINLNKSAEDVSVKAVLGSGKNVCTDADTIYIVGVGKNKSEYSIISSFPLDNKDGTLTYKTSAAIEGRLLSRTSMNSYNGMFRIAAETTDINGIKATSIYVLDENLTVALSAGQLLPDTKIDNVRFEENYASLFASESTEPKMVIDLSSNPPIQSQSLAGHSAYLYSYSDDELLGLGMSVDENGEFYGLTLSMYSAENGLTKNSISFAKGLKDVNSKALYSRRALFIDSEKSLVGVPVYSHNEFGTLNQYYVYSYDEATGFILKGVIEYNDIDDSLVFERAVVNDDVIYVIGNRRVVSAQITDLKVINTITY